MSEFTDYLLELLSDIGSVRLQKMFGGYGLFHDGAMFALVADDELYLKVDAESKPLFEELGLEPFRYTKGDKVVAMSYYAAPEELFDDPDRARYWSGLAISAARRSKKSTKRKRK